MSEQSPSSKQKPPIDSSDAVWASFVTVFPVEVLARHCQNVETLFRLNPYYYFESWTQTRPDSYHAEFENQSNHTRLTLDVNVRPAPGPGLSVEYTGGIKKRTVFLIEPAPEGSRMTIVDDYDLLPAEEREQRQAEVDKSLNAWAESLRVYFQRLKRWSWLPGWRWYIRRFWVPMKPSARRIVWLLYLITVVEFGFFLFVLLIYVIEYGR